MNSMLYFLWDKDGIPTFSSPSNFHYRQEAQECTETPRGFGYGRRIRFLQVVFWGDF